jgi:alkaline phosphatase
MTEAGIQSLSQNENGFLMMIESALIDKAGHKFSQEMGVYEVAALNDLVEYLMGFYNEHPEETLIILTADHETGNYRYDDEQLNKWKTETDFVWTDDGDEMADFVNIQWGLSSYNANLQYQINIALSQPWDTIEENRAPLYTALTLDISTLCGTQIMISEHSAQQVPLYVMGNGYEVFEGSMHIKEIPIVICEIMDWEPLPESLPYNE